MGTSVGPTEFQGAESVATEETGVVDGKQVTARSPLQLFWRRFRRDKVAMVAAGFVVLACLVAILAPLIVKVAGAPDPNVQNPDLLDDFGSPSGPTTENWLGVDQRGRDVLLARGLRRPHLARGRVHLDVHHRGGRRGDRSDRGLLPRDHRLAPHPRDGRHARVPRAAAGDRPRRRVRRRLPRRRDRARPDRRGDGHRALSVALHGADRPRPGAVAAREGVRRGGEVPGRLELAASSSARSSPTSSRRSSSTARS